MRVFVMLDKVVGKVKEKGLPSRPVGNPVLTCKILSGQALALTIMSTYTAEHLP